MRTMARISYQRKNPLRPLNWRWLVANAIAFPLPDYTTRSSDSFVLEVASFLAKVGHPADHDPAIEVPEPGRAIVEAYRLNLRDDWNRLVVELMLLADEPLDKIAAAVGASPAAISSYESMFFHISDRRSATTYIHQFAIRRHVSRGTSPDLERLLRKWVYFGGPIVLATALPAIGRHGVLLDHPADLRTAEGRQAEHVRLP